MLRRFLSTKQPVNFFSLFPKTCASTGFQLDKRALRKEFRQLQQQLHPDSNVDSTNYDDHQSSLLNKGYNTLKNPLTRAQHLLELKAQEDMSDDAAQLQDKALLFEILEIHEQLESVADESELNALKAENDARIKESELTLTKLFAEENWDEAKKETVKLKYWSNIDNAIKNWELGKPVSLTH